MAWTDGIPGPIVTGGKFVLVSLLVSLATGILSIPVTFVAGPLLSAVAVGTAAAPLLALLFIIVFIGVVAVNLYITGWIVTVLWDWE